MKIELVPFDPEVPGSCKVGEFTDFYGKACSIQESSGVEPAIWLGCEKVRMHLNTDMVKALLPHLTKFAKTGSL